MQGTKTVISAKQAPVLLSANYIDRTWLGGQGTIAAIIGGWKVAIWQAIVLVISFFVYLPFIKTNDHLTLKEKNEAIDRYFGQKIGTSHLEKQEGNKKYLKSFFEDTPFNQSGLDIEQKKLTDVELKNMISTYRYLERLNLLKDRDKTFLKLLNTEQRRREGKLEEENVDKGTFLQSFLNEPKPLESMTDVELNHYQDMLLAKIADPEHNITNSERTDLSNIRKILLGLNDLKKNMPSSDKQRYVLNCISWCQQLKCTCICMCKSKYPCLLIKPRLNL